MSYVIYVWYQIQFEILIHACSKLLFLRFEVKEENKNSINQYLQWLKEKKIKKIDHTMSSEESFKQKSK